MQEKNFESLLDRTYRWTWFGQLKFELAGQLGHLFYHKGPPTKKTEYQLLHLGCGPNYFKEFINADYYFLRWLPWRDKSNYDWLLDFRKPMKCPSNHWDGIFTEHTIEHLHPSECVSLFKELYRTMKTNAVLRIVVPGLDQALDAFSGTPTADGLAYKDKQKYTSRAQAVFHLTQNYFHLSVWDFDLFNEMLSSVGFKHIKHCAFMEGSDSRLLKDMPERRLGSMYLEAQK